MTEIEKKSEAYAKGLYYNDIIDTIRDNSDLSYEELSDLLVPYISMLFRNVYEQCQKDNEGLEKENEDLKKRLEVWVKTSNDYAERIKELEKLAYR